MRRAAGSVPSDIVKGRQVLAAMLATADAFTAQLARLAA
ncbi:hypothetical protein ACFL5O_09885 [Myxococcota bacterium]